MTDEKTIKEMTKMIIDLASENDDLKQYKERCKWIELKFHEFGLNPIQDTTLITASDWTTAHDDLNRRKVASVWLGPLAICGRSHRFTAILTRFAHWILRKAGWELIEGSQ